MQSCSECGTKAVRGNTSLLLSLAGVKGPLGCAVRQNSKSDLVHRPIVLELEVEPIASLALGLLHWRRSNRQAAAMMTIQVMEIRPSTATMEILARPSRTVRARTSRVYGQTWTSSACWHTRRRASRGSGSSANPQAGLGLQYARAGTSGEDRASAQARRLFCGYKGIRKLYETMIPGRQ